MLFPKAPASCDKKNFGIIFAALYFYLYELKELRYLKFYFKLEIVVFRGVFFSRYIQLKTSFPDEKNISGEIRDTI